jgi:hypothetical protein
MNYKVMVKALKVIKDSVVNTDFPLTNKLADAIYAIESELAKPEQEPACWITPDGSGFMMRCEPPENDVPLGWAALYSAPPPRKEWVGLTDEEMELLVMQAREVPIEIPCDSFTTRLMKLAEAKFKEKNTTKE